jgi:hypothetical protein
MQYLHHIPLIARHNLDYLLVGQMNSQSIDMLYDEFISLMSKKEFEQMFREKVSDYNFLIINCNSVKDVTNKSQLCSLIKTPNIK